MDLRFLSRLLDFVYKHLEQQNVNPFPEAGGQSHVLRAHTCVCACACSNGCVSSLLPSALQQCHCPCESAAEAFSFPCATQGDKQTFDIKFLLLYPVLSFTALRTFWLKPRKCIVRGLTKGFHSQVQHLGGFSWAVRCWGLFHYRKEENSVHLGVCCCCLAAPAACRAGGQLGGQCKREAEGKWRSSALSSQAVPAPPIRHVTPAWGCRGLDPTDSSSRCSAAGQGTWMMRQGQGKETCIPPNLWITAYEIYSVLYLIPLVSEKPSWVSQL